MGPITGVATAKSTGETVKPELIAHWPSRVVPAGAALSTRTLTLMILRVLAEKPVLGSLLVQLIVLLLLDSVQVLLLFGTPCQ